MICRERVSHACCPLGAGRCNAIVVAWSWMTLLKSVTQDWDIRLAHVLVSYIVSYLDGN